MQNDFTKILILGIDGLCLSLARHLCAKGVFCSLEPVINSSRARAIKAELPEVSPVNWASFYTGKGPEKHGIYGFTGVDPASRKLFLNDLRYVRTEKFWDILGLKGKVSRIINLPCTYPAPALKGMLISGFVAPDLDRAVFPKALVPMLKRMGYRLEADTIKGLTRPDMLLEELSLTIAARMRAFDLFWPDHAFDLFMIVFTELDRMSHFLQDAVMDEKHALHQGCMTVLRELDRACGHVLERFHDLPGPARIMVVADHGFTEMECEVDINAFLRAEGFMKLEARPENELDLGCLDMTSRAFALDPGRIYINAQDRLARGVVSRTEYAGIRDRIRRSLLQLEYLGRKVIEEVHPGEEIYPGGVGLPPDLVCVPARGFDLKAKFDRDLVFGTFGRTGTHTRDDVYFYDSMGSSPERVRDILPGAGLMEEEKR